MDTMMDSTKLHRADLPIQKTNQVPSSAGPPRPFRVKRKAQKMRLTIVHMTSPRRINHG